MSMIRYPGTYTDLYQLTMAQAYYLGGTRENAAVFDYFFRKNPFDGGYAVFAGLEDALSALEELRFEEREIGFLREQGFDARFLEYLRGFRFTCDVHAAREGEVVFATSPVLSVKGPIIEAQIAETLLLNILNFQTLVATKASRMRLAAGDRSLVDFGLRRAQGLGGYHASRAAAIGGFDATSNVRAGMDYGIPVSGTLAHSFIQSHDDELAAFRAFAEQRPQNCILLVDTYDTLRSGVPNAIATAREMEARGHRLAGIRLDSGDLAYLAKRARAMLDEAGLGYVRIVASSQLDEHAIKSLVEQAAPVDAFGVGTSLVTGRPDAALDGVYKLAFANRGPRIKITEETEKITLPQLKQVFRLLDGEGNFYGADAVALAGEKDVEAMHHPFDTLKSLSTREFAKERIARPVMRGGVRTQKPLSVREIAAFAKARLGQLEDEYKRFERPYVYKVGISDRLKAVRDRLIARYRRT